MQNRSGEMEVFVRVVETGSLTRAAHALHLTPSAISKLLARLEARLGATLLRRSARALALTAEGEFYYSRARTILQDIESMEELASLQKAPRGLLRINSNIPFAQHHLLPALPGFLARFPGVTVDISQSDQPVDLIRAQADVAIRTGTLADSALHARRLLDSPRHVVASPDYLARHGRPERPEDLGRHNCLSFNLRRELDIWPFRGPDRLVQDHLVSGNLRLDNGETMRQMALAGVGLARLSEFHIGPDLAKGRLVAVLEEHNPGDREPVQALYVDHAHLADRIRVFIDFLAERCADR